MLLGLARLSVRSLVATLTFFLTAFLTSLFFPLSFITLLTSPPSSPLILARIPVRAALTLVYLPVLFVLASGVRAPFFAELPPSIRPRQSTIQAFSCGVVFTFGLALAGMTRPSKVLSFFYIPLPASLSGVLPAAPAVWDPSLAMVALGGLLPNMVVWQKIKGWEKPSKGEKWEVPRGGKVDAKLVAGAALFGVGWGASLFCSLSFLSRSRRADSFFLRRPVRHLSRPALRRARCPPDVEPTALCVVVRSRRTSSAEALGLKDRVRRF